jgi:hypothetical protein
VKNKLIKIIYAYAFLLISLLSLSNIYANDKVHIPIMDSVYESSYVIYDIYYPTKVVFDHNKFDIDIFNIFGYYLLVDTYYVPLQLSSGYG